jgi:hypothetical protein
MGKLDNATLKNGYIQWQKKLERWIHSSRGDVFMNRKTNGINYIIKKP